MAEQKQSYPKHWSRKLKTVFRKLDLDNDGYLTEEDLNRSLKHRLETYPSLDAEEQRQQMRSVWIDFYNGGQQVPDGYRLSEVQFLQNMWEVVKTPAFKQQVSDMATKTLEQVDLEKKGYISKEEYVKIAGKFVGLDRAAAAFDTMDIKKTGKVTHDELLAALLFYYTNVDDEDNPLNFMKGPLVD